MAIARRMGDGLALECSGVGGVCIGRGAAVAYTDLLQPKEISAVNCNCANLSSDHDFYRYEAIKSLNQKKKNQSNNFGCISSTISLSAYTTTLAFAYKIRESDLLALDPNKLQLEAFERSRTSAAYALLLAAVEESIEG